MLCHEHDVTEEVRRNNKEKEQQRKRNQIKNRKKNQEVKVMKEKEKEEQEISGEDQKTLPNTEAGREEVIKNRTETEIID